ncbi:alpha/beta fold hydrolase [Leptothoe sp. PORK10 BA2]|uniref:alpha/beta fold hydrolase n=1 Tax=Leptothoe sp. PORK10 BA2 TaxID=3110254 RepID=UPI002B210148|nr:alpha/beta hydrolase [Leptothoe sp. PORK10 BA2]MEA5463183.1 alpha/beta hydrolase [Leptothoe sp. PORK10 BA2]
MRPHRIHLTARSQAKNGAPLLIFLPGMDGSDLSLQSQTAELAIAFDARCFCIPEDDTTDWVGLVKRLVELVAIEQQAQPQRPIYLCGESFGACLALKVMGDRPDLFERLILINPASSFNRQPWQGLVPLVQWVPSITYPFAALGLLPFLTALDRISTPNRQALLQSMQRVTPKTTAWRMTLLREFQISPVRLAQVTVPVLLVASTADRLLPSVNEVKRLARIFPHAQTTFLKHSGHICLLESEVSLYQILQQSQFVPAVAV